MIILFYTLINIYIFQSSIVSLELNNWLLDLQKVPTGSLDNLDGDVKGLVINFNIFICCFCLLIQYIIFGSRIKRFSVR